MKAITAAVNPTKAQIYIGARLSFFSADCEMSCLFFTSSSFLSLVVIGVVVAVVGVVVFVVDGVAVFGVVVAGVLVGFIGVRILVLGTGFDPVGQ
jgi:hypothetical protein